LFVDGGCNCSISSNNILNPFTPFGDGSLIRMANLHASILQIGQPGRMAELFAMISERSARLMNLGDYGLKVGNPADVVIIDASTPTTAVATIAPVLAAFKRGRQTVNRPRSAPASGLSRWTGAHFCRFPNDGNVGYALAEPKKTCEETAHEDRILR
jgi:cytosine/creatinine deaminase